MSILPQLWSDDSGQDIAEYAVMLAVILVLVVGTIRLVGSNANNAFSSVASTINNVEQRRNRFWRWGLFVLGKFSLLYSSDCHTGGFEAVAQTYTAIVER